MSLNKVVNKDVISFLGKDKNRYAVIVADPPYNQKIDKWDSYPDEEYWKFMRSWVSACYDKLEDGGQLWIFNNPHNSAITLTIAIELGYTFQNWITWYKKDGFGAPKTKFRTKQETILFLTKGSKPKTFNFNNVREEYDSKDRIAAAAKKGIIKNGKRWFPNANGALRSDVWEFSSQRHKEKVNGKIVAHWHATPKPHDLIETILKVSTDDNSKVLDLFSGSGSTSIVAKKMGLDSVAVEMDKEYCLKIKEQLKNV